MSHSTRKRPKLLIIGSSDTVSPRCFIFYSYPKRRVGAYWVDFIKRGPHCSIYNNIEISKIPIFQYLACRCSIKNIFMTKINKYQVERSCAYTVDNSHLLTSNDRYILRESLHIISSGRTLH